MRDQVAESSYSLSEKWLKQISKNNQSIIDEASRVVNNQTVAFVAISCKSHEVKKYIAKYVLSKFKRSG